MMSSVGRGGGRRLAGARAAPLFPGGSSPSRTGTAPLARTLSLDLEPLVAELVSYHRRVHLVLAPIYACTHTAKIYIIRNKIKIKSMVQTVHRSESLV